MLYDMLCRANLVGSSKCILSWDLRPPPPLFFPTHAFLANFATNGVPFMPAPLPTAPPVQVGGAAAVAAAGGPYLPPGTAGRAAAAAGAAAAGGGRAGVAANRVLHTSLHIPHRAELQLGDLPALPLSWVRELTLPCFGEWPSAQHH